MPLSITDISNLLHVSEASADIYLELLVNSYLSRENLSKLTGRNSSEVKFAVVELLDRGYVSVVENVDGEEVFHATSLLQIEERIDRDKQALSNLEKYILPQVQEPEKLEILKYEGWEGIKQVYVEVLEEAIRTGEKIYAFESDTWSDKIGKTFINNYVRRRIDSKVVAYVISSDFEADRDYKDKYQDNFTEIKLIKDFELDANINIVGGLVMTFSVKNPKGTLHRSMAEANTLRSIFNLMWQKYS